MSCSGTCCQGSRQIPRPSRVRSNDRDERIDHAKDGAPKHRGFIVPRDFLGDRCGWFAARVNLQGECASSAGKGKYHDRIGYDRRLWIARAKIPLRSEPDELDAVRGAAALGQGNTVLVQQVEMPHAATINARSLPKYWDIGIVVERLDEKGMSESRQNVAVFCGEVGHYRSYQTRVEKLAHPLLTSASCTEEQTGEVRGSEHAHLGERQQDVDVAIVKSKSSSVNPTPARCTRSAVVLNDWGQGFALLRRAGKCSPSTYEGGGCSA